MINILEISCHTMTSRPNLDGMWQIDMTVSITDEQLEELKINVIKLLDERDPTPYCIECNVMSKPECDCHDKDNLPVAYKSMGAIR